MAKARKNTKYKSGPNFPNQNQETIVEKFVADHPLPPEWGPNATWSFAAAVEIVKMACDPELVRRPDWGRDGPGEELPRQVEFCQRFVECPDYFLGLVSFARKESELSAQVDIAKAVLREGRVVARYLEREGRDPTDGEIAGEIMKLRELNKFEDFWVGRARKEMVEEDKLIKNKQISRHLDLAEQWLKPLTE